MKKLIFTLAFVICNLTLSIAQSVTRTQHRTAIAEDAVTTGTMTVRKPDYICISTDNGKEQLIMDGTKFTMVTGRKQHTTDSRKNAQFATFHEVLKAVIGGQPVPAKDDITVTTKGSLQTVTITPAGKKRKMFTSFVMTVDTKGNKLKTLRMNERAGNYTEYTFK